MTAIVIDMVGNLYRVRRKSTEVTFDNFDDLSDWLAANLPTPG